MRLLAQRLERVPWVDVRLVEYTFQASFRGVDGFFMGSDLMTFEATSEVFGFRGRRLGFDQAWAVQLIQEQGGHYGQEKNWTPVPGDISV